METLTSPSSAILVGDSGSSRSRDPLLRLPESFFRPSHWFARAAVLHLASARRRAVKPVFSLSPEPQMDLEEVVDDKSQETDHSRTVHVKFQIQKECSFGDEFLLVGDDPMLGLWDPDNGIPLAWSDDHVWTAEMDMPIGKTIQYKFVLKESDGTISWQPGPDRIFQSWETINIITVSEEWEDAENQKLIEDDGYTSPNVNSEVSAVDDEKLYPKQELVSKISDELAVADDDKSYPDGKSMSATPEPIKEKTPIANVADNVGNAEKGFVAKEPQDSVGSPEKDLVANEPKEVPTKAETVAIPDKEDKVIAKEPEEAPSKAETVAITDKEDKVIAKDATTRVAEVKNTSPSSDADKNRTRSVSSPVRVPGLSLEPKVARTQQAALNQQRKESTSADVSDEPKNDAKSSDPPELEKKHDLDYDDDEDTHEQETTEMLDNGEEEEEEEDDQDNSELMKGFYGNDIIWGFRTVQKLLVNLGLA